MRGTVVLVGGLVSLLVTSTVPVGIEAALKKDRVRGWGRIAEPSGFPPPVQVEEVRVNAQSGPLGEAPKGQIFYWASLYGEMLVDIQATVTCLRIGRNVVGLDVATVGGVIKRSRTASVAAGEGFWMAVIGSGFAPGTIVGFAESPPTCPDPVLFFDGSYIELADGGFQVQDASP